jgi:predicted RNase H-like HicB family nuclease
MSCKSPTKVLRRQARIEILEQLNESGPVVTQAEEIEEARQIVDEAMMVWRESLRQASVTLHNTIAAMDPALKRHVQVDHYDERLFTTYWVD